MLRDALARKRHIAQCKRCLDGLGAQFVEVDTSRMTLAFYCFNALDLLGEASKISEEDRKGWSHWIWSQQISGPDGSGFRASPSLEVSDGTDRGATQYDQAHIIMTYTALLSLSILESDMTGLNKAGIVKLLQSSQQEDGSFTATPGWGESDVRITYAAFAVSHLIGDWSGINILKALSFVRQCQSYEGGFGQTPGNEAQGGTTYCSVACFALAPKELNMQLDPKERDACIEWLVHRQVGGFQGRTGKVPDACYSFWCGAALSILGAGELVDPEANASFIDTCQFKFGGIAKAPDEHPDPFHTYMALASLAVYPPEIEPGNLTSESWRLGALDPLINARPDRAAWVPSQLAPDSK